jgi:hypothetical protein
MYIICGSLFVHLYFVFWPLCCLFFFDLRIMIVSLGSPNYTYTVEVINNTYTFLKPKLNLDDRPVLSILNLWIRDSLVAVMVYVVYRLLKCTVLSNSLRYQWGYKKPEMMQPLLKLSLTGMCSINRIGGEMLCVLTSNAVDREFEPRSDHTKIL